MRKRHEQDLDMLLRHLKKHPDKGLLEFQNK